MTYFNPKIYCRENLKESDRRELDFYNEIMLLIIDEALDDAEDQLRGTLSKKAFDLYMDVLRDFAAFTKETIGEKFNDFIVSCIDGYNDDDEDFSIEEQEHPTGYDYGLRQEKADD